MTLAPLADINSRFAIPGSLQFIAGQGGLTAADITCPLAAGRVYLHGAHITQWQPAGHEPVLFLSDAAVFSEGKAIRGGVPICHPWFGPASLGPRAGDPTAPAHGLVRVLPWEVQATSAGPDGSVTVALLLKSTPQTRAQWPFDFTVELRVTFGAALTMELRTCNTGTSPMPFEEALHTYFAVGDVSKISIEGLDGCEYLDKTAGMSRRKQSGDITFAAETDRVYVQTGATCTLHDPVKQRTIRVSKTNSRSTVVWNPAAARAAQLTDIGLGQWPQFVCIETANVLHDHSTLAPGQTHQMMATIEV